MKKTLLLVAMLVLSGCSVFTGGKPYPLDETEAEKVAKCRMVGVFPGPGGYRMMGPPAVLADFKYQAAEKAKEMGATHIYWEVNPEGVGGEMIGYAFDCTGVDLSTDDEEDNGY